jgi:hypothetical protein
MVHSETHKTVTLAHQTLLIQNLMLRRDYLDMKKRQCDALRQLEAIAHMGPILQQQVRGTAPSRAPPARLSFARRGEDTATVEGSRIRACDVALCTVDGGPGRPAAVV